MTSVDLMQKLYDLVAVDDGGCWIFLGSFAGNGYGQFWDNSSKRRKGAHRISYELHFGNIPIGMNVLHRCDNRKCVNPDHLFLGTQHDNICDMVSKDRHAFKGSRHGMARLNEEAVQQILILLADGSFKQITLAAMFGVSPTTICEIKTGRKWGHI